MSAAGSTGAADSSTGERTVGVATGSADGGCLVTCGAAARGERCHAGKRSRSNATWYVRNSATGNSTVTAWGLSTDALVPGNYDGDGKADLAVWRGSDTNWYVLKSSNGQSQTTSYGTSSLGDLPAPGDYDGDNKTDIAVWRRARRPGTSCAARRARR